MMRENKKFLVILLLLLLLVFMSAGEKGGLSKNTLDFLGKSINFLVLFGGLAYFLLKPIKNFLRKRADGIERSLKETDDSRREAEKKLDEANARLASLAKEIEKIRERAEAEGQSRREKIIQFSREEAEKIKSFARQEIEMLSQAEIQHLREYTAELAAGLAEETIKKKLSPEDQSQLIDKSIERLDKLYEKRDSDQKIHPGIN
jgi:F-type H+-transporting ATPase subunit b